MAKLLQVNQTTQVPTSADLVFFCPACGCGHGIWTTKRNGNNAIWVVTGLDTNMPTVRPSLKITHANGTICHCVITAGEIEFCADSSHELRGKRVPLPDFQ